MKILVIEDEVELAVADRLLTVYDDTLRYVLPLPAAYYYKPEGLVFHATGDLLISNEDDKKGLVPANVMRFTYREWTMGFIDVAELY